MFLETTRSNAVFTPRPNIGLDSGNPGSCGSRFKKQVCECWSDVRGSWTGSHDVRTPLDASRPARDTVIDWILWTTKSKSVTSSGIWDTLYICVCDHLRVNGTYGSNDESRSGDKVVVKINTVKVSFGSQEVLEVVEPFWEACEDVLH